MKIGIYNDPDSTFSESCPDKAVAPISKGYVGVFFRFSCHEPFSIEFAIDLTLRFGEHQNGESLAFVRENLCQHLDLCAGFMQAASSLVIPTVF
jgi:hypothetical protein